MTVAGSLSLRTPASSQSKRSPAISVAGSIGMERGHCQVRRPRQEGPDQRGVQGLPRHDPAVELGRGLAPGPGGHDGHGDRAFLPGEQRRESRRAAPVVTDEEDAVEPELVDQGDEVGRVVVQAVRARGMRMLRQAEADLVGHDHAVTACQQRRNDVAPQVAPGGIAVQQQHGRCVSRTLVDVVHPPPVDVGEPGLERVAARDVRPEVPDGARPGVGPWIHSGFAFMKSMTTAASASPWSSWG